MTEFLSLSDLRALAHDCLTRAHAPDPVARAVAAEIAAAEATGDRQNGMEALLRDLRLMRYGRLNANAAPHTDRPWPGLLQVDAAHGFAAAALSGTMSELATLAQSQGIGLLRLVRASDPGGMICVSAALADRGFGVLAFGPEGPGRFAHPDRVTPATLTAPPHKALRQILPGGALGQPADSPLGDPVAHVAWLMVVDAGLAGDGFATAEIWKEAPPPQSAGSIACPAELLEQIVSA